MKATIIYTQRLVNCLKRLVRRVVFVMLKHIITPKQLFALIIKSPV
ncbi:hypothetical protein [Pedobacter namyangjuensis]|nr:hypothetical protein [Pedobacter namyangjuensis]